MPSISLSRTPIPTRNHQSRCLALLSVLPESTRCRRSARVARDNRDLRNHPAMVSEVRSGIRTEIEATTRPSRRYMVPGRSVRDDQRQAAISLAGGRSRRRCDRHPRPVTAQPSRGGALLSQALEGSREGSVSLGHRQVEELRRGAPHNHALGQS